MRSNRDATIFQSIGPSFVLTFPDRGCARIKPRRRIPFDSSAHYYSLLGPITLPLSLVAVPFHSLFFHLSPLRFFTVERAKRSKIDRRGPWKERRAFSFSFFFFNFTTIQSNNPAFSLLFLVSDGRRESVLEETRRIDVERQWKNIREREVWITIIFLLFTYLVWLDLNCWNGGMCVWILRTSMEQACNEK